MLIMSILIIKALPAIGFIGVLLLLATNLR
jgi:hypothetical protein